QRGADYKKDDTEAVANLLEIFPELSLEELKHWLDAADGDLQAAITLILDNQTKLSREAVYEHDDTEAVANLLEIFPELSVEELQHWLDAAEGDLEAAITLILENQTQPDDMEFEDAPPEADMVEFYKCLELSRGCTAAEIKKAYRRLALKWHPDKNPDNQDEATKRFKELSEAYEVLSDEKKRKIYDQYGKEGLQTSSGPGPTRPSRSSRSHRQHYRFDDPDDYAFPSFSFRDPEEVFREFFGGDPFHDLFNFDPFDPLGHSRPRSRHHRTGRPTSGHAGSRSAPATSTALSGQFFSPFGSLFGPSMFPPFGGFGDLHASMNNGGFTSFSTQSFSSMGGPGMKSSSTSTKFVNGKKVTTKKVREGGVETVSVYENDILKSKSVNGIAQPITY
ncbi:unnamed protein product, partial [Meganyctiphanes norvegica]